MNQCFHKKSSFGNMDYHRRFTMWKKAMMGITAVAAALTMSACGGASA